MPKIVLCSFGGEYSNDHYSLCTPAIPFGDAIDVTDDELGLLKRYSGRKNWQILELAPKQTVQQMLEAAKVEFAKLEAKRKAKEKEKEAAKRERDKTKEARKKAEQLKKLEALKKELGVE